MLGRLASLTTLTLLVLASSRGNGTVKAQGVGNAVPTFAGNAQHTGIYATPASNLNSIRWSTTIDLHPGVAAHYGPPLITAANTVIIPSKTATDGFELKFLNGNDGTALHDHRTVAT